MLIGSRYVPTLVKDDPGTEMAVEEATHSQKSKLPISEHLANERTFLAWVRTALAVISFGVMVARIGGRFERHDPHSMPHFSFSLLLGVSFTLLGVVLMLVALRNFLYVRSSIERASFHPYRDFAMLLTAMIAFIAIVLTIFLLTF
ncbi:YidH family protein [Dictyobacter aurantiacus]|uniref:DUF202 domain-containing protein n=1 Tax=Dictyobacter aurantiacus TaxID=1936993 RepID=A0A401ZJB5_9CHLR|nr:DUF202 domain-containing protein [Dictyobacter aurantiacus]GCE06946.1 hypothetical protein KDAU_42750 [Dictyobacter aurantiacus]